MKEMSNCKGFCGGLVIDCSVTQLLSDACAMLTKTPAPIFLSLAESRNLHRPQSFSQIEIQVSHI